MHEASCRCTGITCLMLMWMTQKMLMWMTQKMLMWMTQRMLSQQLEHQEHNAGPPSGPG